MSKIMGKRISLILMSLILLIIIPVYNVKSQPQTLSPTKLKYINDYVGISDENSKQYIVSVGNELENKTGAQEVVVVINSLEGRDIEGYANELFRNWGIGQKDKNNGLLILISLNDKKWRVEVGKGLEGTITDIYSARVMDSVAAPKFKAGDFNDGIKNVYSIFADDIAKFYNVSLEKNSNIKVNENNDKRIKEIGDYIPIAIVVLVFILFLINPFRNGPRGGSGFGGGGFGGGGFGGSGGGSSGGGDFGGFGGGDSGGGGSSGGW